VGSSTRRCRDGSGPGAGLHLRARSSASTAIPTSRGVVVAQQPETVGVFEGFGCSGITAESWPWMAAEAAISVDEAPLNADVAVDVRPAGGAEVFRTWSAPDGFHWPPITAVATERAATNQRWRSVRCSSVADAASAF
jgi:hypothetical protein